MKPVLLSLFPGIDLLGMAFEAEGFFVVRGPDPIFGGDIHDFHPPAGVFGGIIGGPPCVDDSSARRDEPSGIGEETRGEYVRCVLAAEPEWFLLENVPRVPTVSVPGYTVQRLNLTDWECGGVQARLRSFQFGSRHGWPLVVRRGVTQRPEKLQPACMAGEGKTTKRRGWGDFCRDMGLPEPLELPGWSVEAKYRAVGNGVPLPMGRTLAAAIKEWRRSPFVRVCICGCGREIRAGQTMAKTACRMRMLRRRHGAGTGGDRSVTAFGVTLPASPCLVS